MSVISLQELRSEALALIEAIDVGHPLDPQTAALIGFSVRAAVTAMDFDGARDFALRAIDAGATPQQLHEALFLVSGLGVHSLFSGSRLLADLAGAGDDRQPAPPLDDERQKLWDKHIGADKYWAKLEKEVPGFLQALLRQSPAGFEAFIGYCAVPWKSGLLPVLTKELISMAVDATPTHRYLPGMRLHLLNAVRLGAGRAAIVQALDLAAEAPLHAGVR